MIDKVFFMSALLVSGLASAANPSADLSGQIVPGSAVPAPAAAAGFNTLALNADFTSPVYSSTATFVDNCGATTPLRWYWTAGNAGPGTLPCGDVTVVADGSFPQVLLVTYHTTSWAGVDNDHTGGFFLYPKPGFQPSAPCNSPCFPNEIYTEIVWRTSQASWDQGSSGTNGTASWFLAPRGIKPDGTFPANAWWELDYNENFGRSDANPQWGGGMWDWNKGDLGWMPPQTWNTDWTQYHKLGVLTTSDGSTAIWKCTWVDDAFIGCMSGSGNHAPTDPVEYLQHDAPLVALIGGTHNYTIRPVNDVQMWIQSVKIWECPSWQTTTCPGTMVTHWPFP